MKLAIMQPYFFPYIGYFQLINAVDEFVVYDNIKYTKKGWINRNRILVNGKDSYITLPLKNDSDYLDVKDRYLADSWEDDRKKMLERIEGAYRKAPNFELVYDLIEKCVLSNENNLFRFIQNSLLIITGYLGIKTPIYISSGLQINHKLKSDNKVLEICRQMKAETYVNPIGGVELYEKEMFKREGIDLYFLKSKDMTYKQSDGNFVPWLSIIDVMMWNSIDKIQSFLNEYELI